jgi:methionyl-tRNA formyltransferase
MPKLKTVFMGSDPIVLPILESLVKDHDSSLELICVYTQPDRAHGRGLKVRENPVKAWAEAHNIPVRQPEEPGAEDAAYLREVGCDLLLVMAYGHMLSDEILAAPKNPPLNFHASLLPELRGASPIETAIATGRAETGVTLMRIVKKMDAGDILDVEKVAISPDDNRRSLAEKLAAACVPLFGRALPKILRGLKQSDFTPQNTARATKCRILTSDDGRIDFAMPAREIHNLGRAFSQWPGLSAKLEGDEQVFKIGETAVISDELQTARTGEVVASGRTLDVAAGQGILRIAKLQRPGGRMLVAADFLRGKPIPVGARFEGPAILRPPFEIPIG